MILGKICILKKNFYCRNAILSTIQSISYIYSKVTSVKDFYLIIEFDPQ